MKVKVKAKARARARARTKAKVKVKVAIRAEASRSLQSCQRFEDYLAYFVQRNDEVCEKGGVEYGRGH